MIKANELRLGSFIEDEKGNICKVNSINNDCIIAKYHSMGSALGGFEAFNPIKLSEDWLLKLGFYNFGNRWVLDGIPHDIIKGNGFYIANVLYELKFVHQLQNILFSLYNIELTLKD